MMTRRTLLHSTIAMATTAALPQCAFAKGAAGCDLSLDFILGSPRFLVNGVATDAAGTVFVSMPRWTGMDDTPGVGRLRKDGSVEPFPGGSWHDWRNGPASERLLQINAIHIFDDNLVWIVDQGAPDRKTVKPGGQKLLAFNPDGTLVHKIQFDETILPKGASMNDLRKQGNRIYITDSGLGGIILHDLVSGRSLRRLSSHPDLRAAADHPLKGKNGRPLQDANGKRPDVQADMLELCGDGRWFYWATPGGPLRRIETGPLWDEAFDDDALAKKIETVSEIPPIGGTAIDSLGNIYLSDTEAGRIAVLTPEKRIVTLVQDSRLMVPAPQTERLPEHAGGKNELDPPFLVLSMSLPRSIDGQPLGDAVFVPQV